MQNIDTKLVSYIIGLQAWSLHREKIKNEIFYWQEKHAVEVPPNIHMTYVNLQFSLL